MVSAAAGEKMDSGSVRNDFDGTAYGPVIQAGEIGALTVNMPQPRTAVVPRQVPPASPGFVNRTAVLGDIDDWAGRGGNGARVAVLSGLPGMGKSATVRQWVQDRREQFPDGDFYVDFTELRREAGADVSTGVTSCLRALGVTDEYLPPTLGELCALFRSHTALRRVLVVLDDVTEPAQLRALIPGGPGSAVIATSRGRLGELVMSGAELMRLGPLEPAHGLRVLEDLCGAGRVAADPDAAARIVDLCDGLPVALRVAGARLAMHRGLTPSALAAELADEQGRLDALSLGGENAVAAVFTVAYEGLDAEASRLYRLLGVYPGHHWDAETAAALADLTPRQAQRLLDTLEEASLVEVAVPGDGEREPGAGPGHEPAGPYGFHGLVRLHARSQAEQHETVEQRAAAVKRVIDHFLTLTGYADLAVMGGRMRIGAYTRRLDGAAGPFSTKADALNWLVGHRAELLAAVRAAAALNLHRRTWELAEALTALYLNRRYLNDWAESGELGALAAAADGNPAAESRLRALVSRPLLDRGDDDRARAELETAIVRADESGDTLLRASAREFYGRYWDRHDLSRAVETYGEALEFYRLDGDPRGIAIGLYFLGCAQDSAGRHTTALDTLDEAWRRFLALTVKDERMAARARSAIGTTLHHLGRDDEAVTALEEAVHAFGSVGARHYEAPAREALAELCSGDQRLRHLVRALEIYEEGGGPRVAVLRERLSAEFSSPEFPSGEQP